MGEDQASWRRVMLEIGWHQTRCRLAISPLTHLARPYNRRHRWAGRPEGGGGVETLRAAWPDRRLVMVYQPHRYTRTRDLYEDFVQVLSEVDSLLLMEVYPADEEPISRADGRNLCRSLRQRGQVDPIFIDHGEDVIPVLAGTLRDGDILLTQGAGNIGALAARLAKMKLKLG